MLLFVNKHSFYNVSNFNFVILVFQLNLDVFNLLFNYLNSPLPQNSLSFIDAFVNFSKLFVVEPVSQKWCYRLKLITHQIICDVI